MKEMLTFYNNKRILEKTCPACQRTDHFIGECPSIKPNFSNKSIILQYKADSFNERNSFLFINATWVTWSLLIEISLARSEKKENSPKHWPIYNIILSKYFFTFLISNLKKLII